MDQMGDDKSPMDVQAGNSLDRSEKWKRRAKCLHKAYVDFQRRFKTCKNELRETRKRLRLEVREFEALPTLSEELNYALSEVRKAYDDALNRICSFLDNLSLARALNTMTQLTSQLHKKSYLAFSNLKLCSNTKDYLSAAALRVAGERRLLVPKSDMEWTRPQGEVLKKVWKRFETENDFMDAMDSVTEAIGDKELRDCTRAELEFFVLAVSSLRFFSNHKWQLEFANQFMEEARRVAREKGFDKKDPDSSKR